jgi:hypothetical protein
MRLGSGVSVLSGSRVGASVSVATIGNDGLRSVFDMSSGWLSVYDWYGSGSYQLIAGAGDGLF